jgi:hypothetical protein
MVSHTFETRECVGHPAETESAVGTAEHQLSQVPSAVPAGLGFHDYAFPALKRWAKLFHPTLWDLVLSKGLRFHSFLTLE